MWVARSTLRPYVHLLWITAAVSCGGGDKGVREPGTSSTGGSSPGTGGASTAGTTTTASGTTSTGGVSSGTGGASSTGGASTESGGAATTGGMSQGSTTGTGGVIVVTPPPPGSGGSGGTPAVCNELSVVPTPVTPTVLIVVDNSSSMFENPTTPPNRPFDVLYTALMDPTNGVVKALENEIRFGFASYRGNGTPSATEDDPACAEVATVDFAMANHATIQTAYAATDYRAAMDYDKYETPTGFAINQVATMMSPSPVNLATYVPDPPGPKFILLVTDGNPNTCRVLDPQCGQDHSIKAVQDAYAAGIGTFVIGMGEVAAECDVNAARCGVQHLQDLANAGTGQPVEPPPAAYLYQQCVAGQNGGAGVLTATYAADGTPGGASPYFTGTSAEELRDALSTTLNAVRSCVFEMDAIVTGNPSLGSVTVGGTPATYDDPNGWTLDMTTRYSVTLQGSACQAFQSGEADVHISFPCAPDGTPIAIPRE